jgi:hypothetical protein
MLNRRYVFAALVVLLMVAVAFSLQPVRALASDFLGLFRVEKFAAISVSPEQLALLEEVAEEGLYPGEVIMSEEPGAPEAVATIAEAEARVGRMVATVPELGSPQEIQVTSGGSGQLLVDLESARSIVRAAGADPALLPDSLDGAAVDVTLYPTVEQRWSELALVQTQSPLVDYPEDVNPTVLGEALLRVLGMEPAEAERLARSIDWSSTMLLPIPDNFATFREVEVNGESGLALSSVDGEGSSVMWQSGGVVYVLAGQQAVDELLALAEAID